MVKVGYDIYTPPLKEKAVLLNANLIYDTSVSPPQLKGWFEPNFRIGVKFTIDGQLYIDSAFTKGLFATAKPTHPTSGSYALFNFTVTKQALIGIYLGMTTNNYDTPVLVVINRQIKAMLIYNLSANSIQVNHYTDVYPNYETNGSYSAGVVTLAQGQYVLFYVDTKPTVNPNAMWGFTDYEPRSTTTQPSVYIDVTDGTNHYYFEQTLDLNVILHYGKGAWLVDVYGAKLTIPLIFETTMAVRGNNNADGIEPPVHPTDGSPYLYVNMFLTTIYDSDPYAGTSWAEGYVVDNVTYVKDNTGVAIIVRWVKNTTEPYNPRYSFITAFKFERVDDVTIKFKHVSVYKALTNITSYGSINAVINPGLSVYHYSNPDTYEYFDGSSWLSATPGNGTYNYYNGYGFGASIYNPANTSEVYALRMLIRKYQRYGTPPLKIGALKLTADPTKGIAGVFIDYAGGTIPTGNYTSFIIEGLIRKDNVKPTITTETPTEDTDVWTYLYGYPHDISISAPSSATPGSTVTVTVTTNAPDGTKVHVVDKDTDTVLGSGTVTSGQATITFTMTSKNLSIRVYVEGADIILS